MRHRRAGASPAPAVQAEILIEALGAGGDGIATHAGRRAYLADALPGESWQVRLSPIAGGEWRAQPITALRRMPRAEPVCAHFGSCGGCTLQHLPEPDYLSFKAELIATPLRRVGVTAAATQPINRSPLGSRRRVRLAWQGQGRQLRLGFRARGGHRIVPVTACPVAAPAIQVLLAPLADLLGRLKAVPKEGEAQLTVVSNGLDVLLGGIEAPGLDDREELAAFATRHDLVRLAIGQDEVLAERRPALTRIGELELRQPVGAFRQATDAGEAALQAAVRDWLTDATQLVDLYAGQGSLSLPLLDSRSGQGSALHLVEESAAALQAVRAALPAGRFKVTLEARDLERRPLRPDELRRFDAAILDPPRAGAMAQVRELAASGLKRIVYVSCNPASFARDAKPLSDAGYRLAELRPVDQFVYSAAIELAALFILES